MKQRRHREPGLHLTTGDAARMSGINPNTIIELVENGAIKGFKVPESSHRRIPRAEFRRFLVEAEIPTDLLDESDGRFKTKKG